MDNIRKNTKPKPKPIFSREAASAPPPLIFFLLLHPGPNTATGSDPFLPRPFLSPSLPAPLGQQRLLPQPRTSSPGHKATTNTFPLSVHPETEVGRCLYSPRHFQHRSPTNLLPPKNPAAADSNSPHRRHPFLIRQSCSPSSTNSDDPQPPQLDPDLHQPPPNHLKQRRRRRRRRSPKNRPEQEEREADNDGKQRKTNLKH